MAPTSRPMRTLGLFRSKSKCWAAKTPGPPASSTACAAVVRKTWKKASAVRAAEPMAKPFPMAAVVLPTASKASVRWRTVASRALIWAMPPALSATGP